VSPFWVHRVVLTLVRPFPIYPDSLCDRDPAHVRSRLYSIPLPARGAAWSFRVVAVNTLENWAKDAWRISPKKSQTELDLQGSERCVLDFLLRVAQLTIKP
jgi:hypothetical protein